VLKFSPLEYLRSLCFGGVLGYAAGCYLFVKFPAFFQSGMDLNTVALIGAGVGAGVHRFVDTIFIKSIFHPVMEFVSFYERIIEIHLARNLISEDERKAILSKLIRERFLGKEQEPFFNKFLDRVIAPTKSTSREHQDRQRVLRDYSENELWSKVPKSSESEEYDDTDS
jgi:hypothetical protein